MKEIVFEIVFVPLILGVTFAVGIKSIKSEWTGTVYIRADGSIYPPDAPIMMYDNITYTLTSNITSSDYGIVIEKDDIIINGAGFELAGTGYGVGIDLSNRMNVTVKNITVKNFQTGILLNNSLNNNIYESNLITNKWYGICLENSGNSKIIQNRIERNRCGVCLVFSKDNSVKTNSIKANDEVGVYIRSSSLNSIFNNNLTGNTYAVYLEFSYNNTIHGNNVTNNQYGVWVRQSNDNIFHDNNFIDNSYQIFDLGWDTHVPPSVNVWCKYPSGGNYWSDYIGVDYYSGPYQNETGSDGVGDTPYVIDENNVDRYPLMRPWKPVPIKVFDVVYEDIHYPVIVESNSSATHFIFNQSLAQISFKLTGYAGKAGYCNIIIPKSLMKGPWSYTFEGNVLDVEIFEDENENHSTLSFTYKHASTLKITIQAAWVIPEFPTTTLQLTMLTPTTLIAIIWKTKIKSKHTVVSTCLDS